MRCIGFGIVAVGALFSVSAPAKAELLINISKSQQRLSVTINGTEAYRWPVSTGRRGHETPAGRFRPQRLERHWYSHEYHMTPMPWAMFFHRGYAVHGTMEAYNLGHAASHGCVRLRPDKAAILFSLVRHEGAENTKFVVMNGPLPAAPGAVPMARADAAPPHTPVDLRYTKACADADDQQFSARSHAETAQRGEDRKPASRRSVRRVADTRDYRISMGSDEARILREREAWLRSLDRKYGITR